MNPPNFEYRAAGYAVRDGIYFLMQQLSTAEFVRAASNPRTRGVKDVPRYWTWTPAATYIWPRRAEGIKTCWTWEVDHEARERWNRRRMPS